MSGPATTTRPAGKSPISLYRHVRVSHLVAAIVAIAVLIPVSEVLTSLPHVKRITFENPTKYDIAVEVTSGDRDGWMSLGIAFRETSSTFEQVLDQGDEWIFRFRAQGEQGGEFRATRPQLKGDNWRVRIPEAVRQKLLANRAPFPP